MIPKFFIMKNLKILLILLLAWSCKSNTHDSGSAYGIDKFFEINYENVLQNSKIIPLSQVLYIDPTSYYKRNPQ